MFTLLTLSMKQLGGRWRVALTVLLALLPIALAVIGVEKELPVIAGGRLAVDD